MKVKMREYFQGRDVSALLLPDRVGVDVLEPGKEYEVNDAMGKWLLENRKAVEISPVVSVPFVQVVGNVDTAQESEITTTNSDGYVFLDARENEEKPEPQHRRRGRK